MIALIIFIRNLSYSLNTSGWKIFDFTLVFLKTFFLFTDVRQWFRVVNWISLKYFFEESCISCSLSLLISGPAPLIIFDRRCLHDSSLTFLVVFHCEYSVREALVSFRWNFLWWYSSIECFFFSYLRCVISKSYFFSRGFKFAPLSLLWI